MRDFDRREREALDRHITGNYGEDQLSEDCCRQHQRPRWEAGTLSSHALREVLVDALNDLWQDSYRRDNPTFQPNHFREVLNDAIYLATNGQGGRVQ